MAQVKWLESNVKEILLMTKVKWLESNVKEILAVCPAALTGRERFIIIIYNITPLSIIPPPTPSFLRHNIN